MDGEELLIDISVLSSRVYSDYSLTFKELFDQRVELEPIDTNVKNGNFMELQSCVKVQQQYFRLLRKVELKY